MRDAEKLVPQMNNESTWLEERLASAEATEALPAFAEKRKPDFTKVTG
jgi:1,4-dihydroxy-2-naphthoyl-CoA synthase